MSQKTVEERLAKLESRVNGLMKLSIFLLFLIFLTASAVYIFGFYAPDEMRTTEFAIAMSAVFLTIPASAIMAVAVWITHSND